MIKRIFGSGLLVFFLLSCPGLQAQKKYWVFFSDKTGVEFDPYKYFDAATIIKREARHIPLIQFSDLPVKTTYLEGIQKITGKLGTTSRWFNAVSVTADKACLEKISELPYVTGVQEIQLHAVMNEKFDIYLDFDDNQLREAQLKEFGSKYFEDMGIDGTGVRIAVFDGGFPGVDTSPMFKDLRESGRIIATWDFVKKREFVYDYSSHGTSVLTCIAGKIDDNKFGLATGAEFLLARTEVTREVFSEEENWLAAVEWADKNGADIISSSLGYTFNRYFPTQMDGQSTLVTRSGNLAASKGMLVVNAAGNDGDNKWEVIGAPADADSVLSIGGVSPETGYHINFSSYGPTYDGRMKPNLVAFGKVTTSDSKKIKQSSGTSFSTPLVSGFAACVMQIHPEWDNMKVFSELEKSGHLYPYYDYAHGYGVPQASYFTIGKPSCLPTFEFVEDDENLVIMLPGSTDYNYEEGPVLDTVPAWESDDFQELEESDEGQPDTSEVEYTVYADSTSFSEAEEENTVYADSTSFSEAEEEDTVYADSTSFLSTEGESYEPDTEEAEQESIGYDLDRNYLYFHIIRAGEEKLKRYALVNMQFNDDFKIPLDELESGDTIVVYFRGYTGSYEYQGYTE